MSIITYPLNGITYDASDAETYLCTRSSGVFSDESCFDISISGDMSVTISSGIAWIKNDDYRGKSVCMNEDVELELSLGSASYGRIDRIVLRFSAASNETTLEVVEGTASSSPKAPDITQTADTYELGLYTISVPAGTTEISDGDITDTRMDEDVCGLMADSVTEIPTSTLYAQVTEMINTLQNTIEGVEAGSEYMLSSLYDPAGGASQVAFTNDLPHIEWGSGTISTSDYSEYDNTLGTWYHAAYVVEYEEEFTAAPVVITSLGTVWPCASHCSVYSNTTGGCSVIVETELKQEYTVYWIAIGN